MISSRSVWTARGAVIGAVIATFVSAAGLAGCGRKGGLDPPPAAAAVPVDEHGAPVQPAGGPGNVPNGQPVAAPPPRKGTWLDWLID